ncbi:hypothetical protein B0H14DRAFT_3725803 [Mycena olivaceomarginata]|nr:hypothetical protein B0H14DRAFT_3725803 [Mycena olivaceomarginata]
MRMAIMSGWQRLGTRQNMASLDGLPAPTALVGGPGAMPPWFQVWDANEFQPLKDAVDAIRIDLATFRAQFANGRCATAATGHQANGCADTGCGDGAPQRQETPLRRVEESSTHGEWRTLPLIDLYAVLDLRHVSRRDQGSLPPRPARCPPRQSNASQPTPDIAAIKDAYRVLFSPALRAKAKAHQDPRPAQVISLADFDEQGANARMHACRCGGTYAISGAEMDRGVHLVPCTCTSCSEVVWVGYELAEEE